DFLDARMLYRRGEFRQAAQQLQQLTDAIVGWPEVARQADLLLGTCCEQLGDTAGQLTAYRRALIFDVGAAGSTERSRALVHYGLGKAMLAMGRLDEAVSEYREMMVLPGAP